MEGQYRIANRTIAEHAETAKSGAEQAISLAQGAYYLTTGVWPLISMRSFESVTGPKADKWLVKTVGVLVGVIGASLMLAARRKAVSSEARLLATGSAAGLAFIDVIYVANARISPVYLLDAAGEIALLKMWKSARAKTQGGPKSPSRQIKEDNHRKERKVRKKEKGRFPSVKRDCVAISF
jgi:hypothetical protein